MRRRSWVANCIALGLAAGFLEPLESTSIQLIQTAIGRLISLFPDRGFASSIASEYNRLTALEYEGIRDFLVLHYTATKRDDTPFWREMRHMQVPANLMYRRSLFERIGRTATMESETFQPASWLSIYAGNRIVPTRHEPVADTFDQNRLARHFEDVKGALGRIVPGMPTHIADLAKRCP